MPERVFICGAAKAGTNTVFDALSRTEGVITPRLKEPGYFSPDVQGSQKVSTLAGYHALFAGVGSHTIDGSVSYLLSEVAAADILRHFPDARFIVCLRRQAEMARSFHGQLRRNATESIPEFPQAWAAQPNRAAGHDIPATIAEPRLLQYRWVCSVGSHVERLLETVPRSQILFIEHERLVVEPDHVRRQVADHLHLPTPSVPAFERTNEAREWRIDPYPILERLPTSVLETVRRTKGALDRKGYPPTRLFRLGLRPTGRSSVAVAEPGQPDHRASAQDESFLQSVQASFAADTERLRAATGLQLAGW